MSFIAFGLMSFVAPSVASAELLDLDYSCRVALVNESYRNVLANPSNYLTGTYGSDAWSPGNPISVHHATVGGSSLVYSASSHEIGTSTDRLSGTETGTYSGTGNEYGYIDGTYDGSYDNPQSVLGDVLFMDGTISGSTYTTTSENGTTTGNISCTILGNQTSDTTTSGTGSTVSNFQDYLEIRPSTKIDISNFNNLTLLIYFEGFGVFPDNTPLYLSGFWGGSPMFHNDNGTNSSFTTAYGYMLAMRAMANITQVQQSTSGRYFPNTGIGYSRIVVVVPCNYVIAGRYDSLLFPNYWKLYRDLGNESTEQISGNINSQTNSINNQIQQQTQNQTNQLKDTTGSDGILSVPKNVGNSIYEQVTFTNQIAGISSQLATTVASADASEGGFTLPSWEFQGQQIWPQMTVSPWTDIPIDIKSKVRLFNTMVFAILWIRSLWNWIASIFGFEQVDDSGGAFDDMFDDDDGYSGFDYNAASKRSNEMMKKLGYYH